MSIMNMPPCPTRAHSGRLCDMQRMLYRSHVWDRFDPALMTLCSPDPQAFPPPRKSQLLQVGCRPISSRRAFLDPTRRFSRAGTDIEAALRNSSCR